MQFFEPIFRALNEAGTRYVAVGGIATILHGYIRLTRDIDLVVDLSPQDASRTVSALEAAGFKPLVPVAATDFADGHIRERWIQEKNMVVFSMRHPGSHISVDLFVQYPVDFDGLWERSVLLPLNTTLVRVASLDDLITIKRAAGRPKDMLDVEQLEHIKRLQADGRWP